MSVRDIERAIVAEARVVLCNQKLRLKDLQEWSSATIPPQDSEVVIVVDAFGARIYAAFPKSCDRRAS